MVEVAATAGLRLGDMVRGRVVGRGMASGLEGIVVAGPARSIG